ncbi:MAG: hypothetical protein ACJZ76_03370 [Candidatus Pelagibacter sp.]
MTSKEAQKELQRINQLTFEEREFVKSTFLYDYLVLVAHKGTIDPRGYLDNSEF